jgi:hypothetical protein
MKTNTDLIHIEIKGNPVNKLRDITEALPSCV